MQTKRYFLFLLISLIFFCSNKTLSYQNRITNYSYYSPDYSLGYSSGGGVAYNLNSLVGGGWGGFSRAFSYPDYSLYSLQPVLQPQRVQTHTHNQPLLGGFGAFYSPFVGSE